MSGDYEERARAWLSSADSVRGWRVDEDVPKLAALLREVAEEERRAQRAELEALRALEAPLRALVTRGGELHRCTRCSLPDLRLDYEPECVAVRALARLDALRGGRG